MMSEFVRRAMRVATAVLVGGLGWTRQAGDGVLRNWAGANTWAVDLVFGGFDD